MSKDPIGLLGGLNLQQYAPNPNEWIDPLGLTSVQRVNPRSLQPRQGPSEMSNSKVDRYAKNMKKTGYDENYPIDAADVGDGKLVTIVLPQPLKRDWLRCL